MDSLQHRRALIVGATGLVGDFCLQHLLRDVRYGEVVALARKPLLTTHRKLKTILSRFQKIESDLATIQVDDVFCCLGTTIRKAGSQEAFRRVDLSLVVTVAKTLRRRGAGQFIVISSMGADPDSRVFYNRVKGEMERAVQALGYPCLRIIRPSLLLGPRQEFRPGEKLGALLTPLFGPLMLGALRKYRPVQADAVARFMVSVALEEPRSGVHWYESDRIGTVRTSR